MRVLGVIPARGGSKGVPRKNIKPLCGKPLLAYTAESAVAAKLLSKVILSTEDFEIADVGKSLGLEVPFLRPSELAKDSTPTLAVVVHAVECMEKLGENYDAICILQPTSPLRRSEDIDNCIELLKASGADSVVSVMTVPDTYNPKWVFWKSDSGRLTLSTGEKEPITRRQDLPPAVHREGSVYVMRRQVLTKHGNLYGASIQGYEIDPSNSVNIDTFEDWELAEQRMRGCLSRSSYSAAETSGPQGLNING